MLSRLIHLWCGLRRLRVRLPHPAVGNLARDHSRELAESACIERAEQAPEDAQEWCLLAAGQAVPCGCPPTSEDAREMNVDAEDSCTT